MLTLNWLWTFFMGPPDKSGLSHPASEIWNPPADPARPRKFDPGARPALAQLRRELQACREELETYKQELVETRQNLESACLRYAELYDCAPVGYLTLDEKGRAREINLTGAAMLGRERSRMLGKHFIAWLAEGERAHFLEHLRLAFQTGSAISTELRIKAPTGVLRDVRLESAVVRRPGHAPVCRVVMSGLAVHREVARS